MTDTFSPATWRVLGLSVAISYTGLGVSAIVSPAFAGRVFGLRPAKLFSEDPTSRSFALLGVRDISFGVALFALANKDMPEAMGTVILSSMVLCVYDVYEVARNNGWVEGALIGSGAAMWGLIGWGLLGVKSWT